MTSNKFMCDFETTTDVKDCRVWATAKVAIGDNRVEITNSIDRFMASLQGHTTYYFHNLKFDGQFIVDWLFKHGYEWKYKESFAFKLHENEFTTLISDTNIWYSIEIGTSNGVIHIIDSNKIIPFSVEKIGQGWGGEIAKGKINYDKFRDKNHKITKEEADYITKDVLIVANALNVIFEQGLNKMTQGGNALHDFKRRFGSAKRFQTSIPASSL